MNKIKDTESLCPECMKVLPAEIYEEGGKVYIRKTCPEHGEWSDLYWGDYEQYKRAEGYASEGKKLENPRTTTKKGCPYDCGICPEHKSHTVLAIVDITNRCNLRCPICFAHAGAAGYLYEPTKEEIRGIFENLRANRPVSPPGLQFSGGEPTVREDLPELIKMARDMGFRHIEINSNGIKMAESVEYCRTLKAAGASTVYLQFDGVTAEPYKVVRGFDLLPIKKRALANLKAAGFTSVVLVPVLVGGANTDQVGDIIRFAIDNIDIVRCVNFQPVAITGRINTKERETMRVTIPDLMRFAEEQSHGLIKRNDWFPVPTPVPFTEFLGHLKGKEYIDFSVHPHCGMATYLVLEGDKVEPITKFVNVEGLMKSINSSNRKFESGNGTTAKAAAVAGVVKNVKMGTFRKYLLPLLSDGSYDSLSDLHHKMLMIGSMHFMDPYNFDLERVQRCVVHYATPDGRITPFCTMNTLHRAATEKKFAKKLNAKTNTPLYDVAALNKKILAEES
jgi:7,8-dihydro-6-hydroxymethylpterin dimethyltransferase